MEPLLTWRYFLIPEDKFDEVKEKAEKLDSLRNRELTEEENELKETLIDEINEMAEKIAHKTLVYQDDLGEGMDGTITEELVYRMDEAGNLNVYSDGFYFHFLVYIKPDALKEQYDTIKKIFSTIADHNLLKEDFLGKWEYLDRAKEIFKELRELYKDAYENNCGVIKTDKVEWADPEEDEDDEEE